MCDIVERNSRGQSNMRSPNSHVIYSCISYKFWSFRSSMPTLRMLLGLLSTG